MSGHSTESRKAPTRVLRWLIRISGVVIGVSVLFIAIFFFSRYISNSRLLELSRAQNTREVNVSIGFRRFPIGGLNRFLSDDTQLRIFSRPVSLLLQVDHPIVPNENLLSILKASSGLEEIWIHNRPLPAGCLEIIASQHNPKIISFRRDVIDARDAALLSRMKTLKHIHLDQFANQSRSNDWSWLPALPNLERLEANLWFATNADVEAIAACPAATLLSLSGPTLSDESLVRLCELPALNHLSLEGQQIRLQFPGKRQFPRSLTSLEISAPNVTDESLQSIAGLPQVNRVWIQGGQITSAGLAILAELPALNQLWLTDLKLIDDEALKRVATSPSLTEIRVSGCATTPQALIYLNDTPNWTTLAIDDVGFQRLPQDPRPNLTSENVVEQIQRQRERIQAQRDVVNGPAPGG